MAPNPARRLRRLAEALEDEGVPELAGSGVAPLVLDELDYALRPRVHERRVPTYGSFVVPAIDPAAWEKVTTLEVDRRRFDQFDDRFSRLFADGLSSWALRSEEGITELITTPGLKSKSSFSFQSSER